MLLAVLFGSGIGISLGMLGGGGSILAVPALVYGLGLSVRDAVPASLLVVGGSALAGTMAHLRSGEIPWRTALMFGGAGIAGSFAGAVVNHRSPEDWILGGFAVLMFLAAAAMLRDRSEGDRSEARSCENVWRERPLMVLGVGAAVGVLTGLFGVGGGFILVPAWVLVMRCPVAVSVGASLLVIVLNSAGALVSHLGRASIDLQAVVPFVAAGIFGAVLGDRLSHRVAAERLMHWFAYLVIAVGMSVLIQVLFIDDPVIN